MISFNHWFFFSKRKGKLKDVVVVVFVVDSLFLLASNVLIH